MDIPVACVKSVRMDFIKMIMIFVFRVCVMTIRKRVIKIVDIVLDVVLTLREFIVKIVLKDGLVMEGIKVVNVRLSLCYSNSTSCHLFSICAPPHVIFWKTVK